MFACPQGTASRTWGWFHHVVYSSTCLGFLRRTGTTGVIGEKDGCFEQVRIVTRVLPVW